MKKIILSIMLCVGSAMGSAETINIDTHRTQPQKWEGWGVSLCWWAQMCGKYDEQHLDSLISWLTDPQGLNYNIFRYNIGGGDDPEWKNCEPHHMGKRGGKACVQRWKASSCLMACGNGTTMLHSAG